MKLSINYRTERSQRLLITGNIPELGSADEVNARAMNLVSYGEWELELPADAPVIEYNYLVEENGKIIRREWGDPHRIEPKTGKECYVRDMWKDYPAQHHLYTSAFTDVFFRHRLNTKYKKYHRTYRIVADCPFVRKGQVLKIIGASELLGEWDPDEAPSLEYVGNTCWQISLDRSLMPDSMEYRLIICDKKTVNTVHLDETGIRRIFFNSEDADMYIEHIHYRYDNFDWKAAGISIPVFSLRSEDSFGIGEFTDIKKMIDWTASNDLKVIQILPVNDTTSTYTWYDSYPYNTISVFALHPVYFGANSIPLNDKNTFKKYHEQAALLNALREVDFEQVLRLKYDYLRDLYEEIGENTLKEEEYKQFYRDNERWLFPYGCFCYFRDKFKTTYYASWDEYKTYDEEKLRALVGDNEKMQREVKFTFFTQYLLHVQLLDVKLYAREKGVILKGDIPIGVNRYGVETWTEPHLFNLRMQTGAPPDEFAREGQNWGFPIYNWQEMAKDNYGWWQRRFAKMSLYFDAYRIDHILGFFRIWEIPDTSVRGILGHFNPALPFTGREIKDYGLSWNVDEKLKPYIHDSYLPKLFGDNTHEVTRNYLVREEGGFYKLSEKCNTQRKIKALIPDDSSDRQKGVREDLYRLCEEVLFVEDPSDSSRYHPRVDAKSSYLFNSLTEEDQEAYSRLYDDYYYHRHVEFWKQEALKKLPALLAVTNMLPCGEDMGMIPASTPVVMRMLQILSLDVERWSKDGKAFTDLSNLHYLSVCTTSTHDMSPIREWWTEDREITQQYYNEVLKKTGDAPEYCTPELCSQIISNHFAASSMLVILPLQDWLSIDGTLRVKDGISERINIPANPEHYWRYRMHLTLEEFNEAGSFNERLRKMLRERIG